MQKNKKLILFFKDISIKDIPLVGGKNASLGEMFCSFAESKTKNKKAKNKISKINIPNGFAVTAFAYQYFIKENKLDKKIKETLTGLNAHNLKDLAKRGEKIRKIILAAKIPKDLEKEIIKAYKELSKIYSQDIREKKLATDSRAPNIDVAVRSSATAEDLPDASFAGQQESYLNIKGEKDLLKAVKKCFASLFTNRAISYRQEKKFNHFKVSLSIGVQKMVRSDKASAGVMFTIDTESGFRDIVLINASYGLGENVVKGEVNPDQYFVFKPKLKEGFEPIVGKAIGAKKKKMIYNSKGGTKNIPVFKKERQMFVLKDEEILTLAKWGMEIEKHYQRPMDIEWAKDGKDGNLYIVQARPETVKTIEKANILKKYVLLKQGKVLLEGESVGEKIGQGKVHIIKNAKKIKEFKKGEVLVTRATDPDWEPIMRMASAIITELGGKTSHAAIVSRELGTPCVVGTGNAAKILKNNQAVTISSAEGEVGRVYQGILPFKIKKVNLDKFEKPKTKIMMNIGIPRQAFSQSFIPNDGVGLAREEFIIANFIKIHPLALINFKNLKDRKVKKEIEEITVSYKSKTQFFVDKLAQGIGRIAAAFYPKDVIVRTSDFKSNEYRALIGGEYFEPDEENPMLGWRGASRYYDKKYKAAFILECKAIKKVREEFGLDNVKVMIPFCRTPKEGKKVLSIMKEQGLVQGKNSLEVYVMVEIPSNVILADGFAKIFDGFSIGTNDLTQLTLGTDRDSELISHIFDARDQAVKKLVSDVIKIARKNKIKIGICGQAPSDYPDFASFLVQCGIDSISLNPDTVLKTSIEILKTEKRLKK
jgi:pyruvate,water dikinase